MRLHAYPKLSERNKQVYDLLITDMSVDEMMQELGISRSGVKHHISIVLRCTKCQWRHELTARHYAQILEVAA